MTSPHSLAAAARDLLTGMRCAGCAEAGVLLCDACAAALLPQPRRCRPDPCPGGLLTPTPVTPWCAASYTGITRTVLIEFKENRRDRLAEPLGLLLAAAVAAATGREPVAGWILVPVASSTATVRSRGYDAVALLTRIAARLLRRAGYDVLVTRSLRHRRRVADQAALGAEQRLRNLDGALRSVVTGWPPRREVIVVDDVITTGATLSAAVQALRESGAEVRRAAVVAATPRDYRNGRRRVTVQSM